MFRLGKQGENPRPLKVMFQDEKIPLQILSKCKNLKNLSDINVYIKPDRTASERKEYDRLSRKKRDLEKDYLREKEEDQPRVLLNKGKLTVDGQEMDSYKTPQSLF